VSAGVSVSAFLAARQALTAKLMAARKQMALDREAAARAAGISEELDASMAHFQKKFEVLKEGSGYKPRVSMANKTRNPVSALDMALQLMEDGNLSYGLSHAWFMAFRVRK